MRRVAMATVGLARLEVRVYAGVLRLLGRRPDVPLGAEPHRYVGAVAVLLWAFTVVSAVELVALHLVLPWEPVRVAADVLGVWGLTWCLGMTGCHYVYPHLVTADALVVRAAAPGAVVRIEWADITAVSVREGSHDSSRMVQLHGARDGGGATLAVVVGSRTNVHLSLRTPLDVEVHRLAGAERCRVAAVSLFADDPRALASAIRRVERRGPV